MCLERTLYIYSKKKKSMEVGGATKRRLEVSTSHFVPRVINAVEIFIIPWKQKR